MKKKFGEPKMNLIGKFLIGAIFFFSVGCSDDQNNDAVETEEHHETEEIGRAHV